MKNKVLKVVSGVMLSAMLAVTAVFPAQATVSGNTECKHPSVTGTATITYPNADQQSHQVKVTIKGTCDICKEKNVTHVDTYSQPHHIGENGTCICGFKPQR